MVPEVDAGNQRWVLRHVEHAGVAIAAVNAHTNRVRGLTEARQANFEFVKRSLGLGADLGAPYVITGELKRRLCARKPILGAAGGRAA
jgi:sugar phosphate isomerase/epimerase